MLFSTVGKIRGALLYPETERVPVHRLNEAWISRVGLMGHHCINCNII